MKIHRNNLVEGELYSSVAEHSKSLYIFRCKGDCRSTECVNSDTGDKGIDGNLNSRTNSSFKKYNTVTPKERAYFNDVINKKFFKPISEYIYNDTLKYSIY